MLRIFLEVVLPFLAPFLAFGAYRLLVTRARGFLERTPWFVLTATGMVLACASLVSLAFLGGEKPGGTYVPPHIEDGRIVPGEVKPR
jgi:Family of unknown function (DUF6111)